MKSSVMMAISGTAGLGFFMVANFTNLFTGSAVISGCLQLAINGFVFVVWSGAFRKSSGIKKWIASSGIIVPVVMGSITLWRVLLPKVFN